MNETVTISVVSISYPKVPGVTVTTPAVVVEIPWPFLIACPLTKKLTVFKSIPVWPILPIVFKPGIVNIIMIKVPVVPGISSLIFLAFVVIIASVGKSLNS